MGFTGCANRTHTVGRDFGNGAVRRHFDEFLIERLAIRSADAFAFRRDHDVLARAGLAVDDSDRFGVAGVACAARACIARISLGRRHRHRHRTAARTVVAAGPRRHRGGFGRGRHRGFLWRHCAVQIDRHGDHRFTAEGIVAYHRPQDKNAEEDRECRTDDQRQRA
jgi:hypothetical protein